MTKAKVNIELKKGDKAKINDFVGERKGEGIKETLIYTVEGTIKLNGVKVQGDCVRVSGNVVTVGFVEVRDCYGMETPNNPKTRKYLGKSYSMDKPTAELWDTTSNPHGLDTLSFESPKGIKYSFIMKDYL